MLSPSLIMGSPARASASGVVNPIDGALFPQFKAAVSQVQAGTGDAPIVFVGDSTTAGLGASSLNSGYGGNSYSLSPVAHFNTLLAATGISVNADTWISDNNMLAAPPANYDPRRNLGTDWDASLGNLMLGGRTIRCVSPKVGRFIFTPGTTNFDRVDIVYTSVNTANTMAVGVDGGSAIETFSLNDGVGNVTTKHTTTVPLGSATVEVWRATGTAQFQLMWFRCWRSTQKQVDVYNAGFSGGTAFHQSISGQPFALENLSLIAPKLTIINLGINDAATAPATFETEMNALIDRAQTLGDVLLVQFNNLQTEGAGLTAIRASITSLAASQSVPLIDLRTDLGTWAAANAAGRMYDTTHPSDAGYTVIANSYYQMITA